MWIHRRKHSPPCPVLPWQEPAEAICRAGGSVSTTELKSYLGVTNLLEKKKVCQNGWHLAIFELACFDWRADMEVRVGIGGIMLRDDHEL